jgi:hypothetical protein
MFDFFMLWATSMQLSRELLTVFHDTPCKRRGCGHSLAQHDQFDTFDHPCQRSACFCRFLLSGIHIRKPHPPIEVDACLLDRDPSDVLHEAYAAVDEATRRTPCTCGDVVELFRERVPPAG